MSAARDTNGPWLRFICRACGFVYDEEHGDPDGGLAPGTRFEDIPDDWACPLCGVSKKDFDPFVPSPTRGSGEVAVVRTRRHAKRVVIVGGGLAGWSVARALRRRDARVDITLVAADAADVYAKPALSLALGQGRSGDSLVDRTGAGAAEDLSVRLVAHTFAIAIDASRRRLRTTRGSFDYDALVLASGARPVEVDHLPSALCWRINSLDAWTRLSNALSSRPFHVAVIGAGLVGCELADDLAHAGHRVTVLDPASRPLAAWASDAESAALLDAWRSLRVRFVGGTSIASVVRSGSGVRIATTDDERYDVDAAIVAIGLVTDRRLSDSAGLAFDRGIAVDARTCATSDPAIFATGDCVSMDGRPCRFIEPIARQAEAIAAAILDEPAALPAHRMPLVRMKARSAPMTLTIPPG